MSKEKEIILVEFSYEKAPYHLQAFQLFSSLSLNFFTHLSVI